MKSRFIVLTLVLTLLLSACTLSLAEDITPPPNYQSPTPGPTMSPLFPQSAPSLASGAAIYAEKCAPCHGDKGLGDGPMASQLQKAPTAIGKPEIARLAAPANWYTVVTQGNINSFMPPFNASLSDQQRWDVVAYAMSLGGSTLAEAEKGKTVFEANCAKCHALPGQPAGQGADLSNQAMMAKLTQSDIANFVDKGVGKMPGLGGLLPVEDIYAAAAYVRSFSVVVGQAAAVVATPLPATPASGTPAATPDPSAQPTTAVAAGTPADQPGTIAGKINNGSGGTLPADLKAVLHVFEHDTATQQFSEVSTQETTIAADGAYKFENIPMPSNRAFFVSVNYANTEYESDPIFPTAGQNSLEMPLTIYDTTTDLSGLVANQAHILLDYSKSDVIQVVEFLIITNPGNKSIIAAQKGGAVVKIALPKGYTNLQFEQGAIGDRYVKTDEGFADTTPVTPGTNKYQLVFAVDLPLPKAGLFGGPKLEINQPFNIKINGLSVLVPPGITVEGSGFTQAGLQDMGTGAKFQVYNGTSIEPGKSLQFTASGSAQGSTGTQTATTNSPNQNIIFGVGAFGLVLIIVGIWMYWRDRKTAEEMSDEELDDEDEDGDNSEDDASLDEIMDAIVALDDQFKAGNIQEAAYKERRAELKSRLKSNL